MITGNIERQMQLREEFDKHFEKSETKSAVVAFIRAMAGGKR